MTADPDKTAKPARADGDIARNLLERPLPEGYREEWARLFAKAEAPDEEDAEGDDRTVVIFRIGGEWLALPTGIFHEVAEPRRCHSLPHRRDQLVLGIVNVRGELVICVSLAALLGIVEAGAIAGSGRIKAFPRLVVIGREGRRVAFPADEVHGIHRFQARDLVEVPATIGRSASSFASGMIAWRGHSVGRLDGRLILDALDRSIA